MTQEQLQAFLGKVKSDSSLQDKLKAAKSSEDVLSIAKEHGHEFTALGISQPLPGVSEEELEGVAGGGTQNTHCEHMTYCGATLVCCE